MNRLAALIAAVLLALPAMAQDTTESTGADLRVLDKLSGVVSDINLATGASDTIGRLNVQLDDCRYPTDNPSGEAYAHLTISESAAPIFAGWMIATSPGLSALDHPRYDVWVMQCALPEGAKPQARPRKKPVTDDGSGG